MAALSGRAASAGTEPCPSFTSGSTVAVRYVIDGDTVILEDGRHVRLIGINAMELGHDGALDQPYAQAARTALMGWVDRHADGLRLHIGTEGRDPHGRTLAYLFTDDGSDAGKSLVQQGLAVVVAIPPNLERTDCYAADERTARQRRLAIWSADSSLVHHARDVKPVPGGFLILRDKITAVHTVSAGVHLMLGDGLALWIPHEDLQHFAGDPTALLGKSVLVRGWVREYRGAPEIDVHASAALFPEP